MRSAFAVVAQLGQRLEKERGGVRDMHGLVQIVAETGDWNGASCLADALGMPPEYQEKIYREVYGPQARPRSEAAPTHREGAPHVQQATY